MVSCPKIAIVYPASVPWMGHFLDGIRRYARPLGGWRLHTSPPALAGTGEHSGSVRSLVGWKGDAVIAAISSEEDAMAAKGLGIPVINISAWIKETYGLPRVGADNQLAGRLAADHLIGRGLRDLAFLGWQDVHYSDQRLLGFSGRAEEMGASVRSRLDPPGEDCTWGTRLDSLAGWLASLPHPCGVFAVHDYRAQLLIEACDIAGLRVPNDIAVIGMDDDVITCEHAVPTLTSVSRNSVVIGWEAAALIHRILEGSFSGEVEILVPPDRVTARQSTDMLYHADQVVQIAIGYMHRNLRNSFNIEAVARQAGVSKRTLEMRFRSSMGKSPHRFLTEARIAHARKLLSHPVKVSIQSVADDCGFKSYPAFVAAFQRISGCAPLEFKKQTSMAAPH